MPSVPPTHSAHRLPIPKRRTIAGLAATCVVIVSVWPLGCGSNPALEDPNGTGSAPAIPAVCGTPNEGCPCSTPGEVVDCGSVDHKSGTYVSCSLGRRACTGGVWGACVGDQFVTTKTLVGTGGPLGGNLTTDSLGTGGACTGVNANPCDPFCNAFVDDSSGVVLPEAGTVVIPVLVAPLPGQCWEPTGPEASVYANLPTGSQGNPAPTHCVSGAGDTCNHDYTCGGGTCAPYATGGTNAACTTLPDFTAGMGCWDGTTNGWNLEVCNRGGVLANTGNLVVGINTGSPTGTPGTCPYPTGPLIGSGPDKGHCSIPLATNPLFPGECINFNVATSPFCSASAGGSLIASGDEFAVVNVPATILAGATPLAECDTCNNYTAFHKASNPPALSGAQACVVATCIGTPAACTTTVTGTVTDPGQNVPLPNIAVYQPATTPLAPFTAGVSCDTCASLIPPTVNTTSTDVDGKFTLCVTPGVNVPVVIQTGRWRKLVTLPTVTAGTATALTAVQSRMPQTSAEGDIPLTAIAMGSQEAGECTFAKIMGGTTEMDRPAAGKRIQLFHGTGANTTTSSVAPSAIFTSQAAVNAFDEIWIPCGGSGAISLTATQQGYLSTWGGKGGKMFIDHRMAEVSLQAPSGGFSPWNTTSTWGPTHVVTETLPTLAKTLGTDAPHNLLRTWLTNRLAYGGGTLTTPDPQSNALIPNSANAIEWLRAEGNNDWVGDPTGNYDLMYSFDLNTAGVVPQPGSGCGRVVYSAMHVDPSRGTASNTFPSECTLGPAMSANEKAFTFMLFALAGCSVVSPPVPPPLTPPPPPPPSSQYFTRDYQAPSCGAGSSVEWEFFSWQATIPPGSSIGFQAQTAQGATNPFGPANTAASASPPPVNVGTASMTTTPTGTWFQDSNTVDYHLRTATPTQSSQQWLRITMSFNTGTGGMVPTLSNWKQVYDCVPSQ